jgi:hypothetical protein
MAYPPAVKEYILQKKDCLSRSEIACKVRELFEVECKKEGVKGVIRRNKNGS